MILLKRTVKSAFAILTIVLCLCACQATPTKNAVVNKNQDYLKDINLQPVQNNMDDIPKNVQESFELAKGKVTINAKVTLPNTNVFPIYKIKPRELTNDDIDQFVNIFFDGQPLYETSNEISKEEIAQQIIDLKQQLTETNFSDENVMESATNAIKEEIAALEKQYAGAKSQSELKNKSTNAHFIEMDGGEGSVGKGYAKLKNGNAMAIQAFKNPSLKSSFIVVKNFDKLDKQFYEETRESLAMDLEITAPNTTDNIPSSTVSFQQAQAQAEKILQDTKLSNFVLDYSGHKSEHLVYEEGANPEKFYFFTYAKVYGGIPATYVSVDHTELDYNYNNVEYAESFPSETFEIVIDKDGNVQYVVWCYPEETIETIANNISLMPFNEIMNKFKTHAKAIGNWNNMPEVVNKDIDIYEIKLSMFKSALKDNPNEYITIPVWNFFCTQNIAIYDNGNEYENKEDEFRRTLVTINAIDGSVINQLLGY